MDKLKIGDKVAVISPAGKVEEEKIMSAIKILEDWGLKVQLGKHAFDVFNKMAGKDEDRLKDLQDAIDNPNIKAIFCSRGGYGLVRIIDKVNWSKFTDNPKWIIGFSDVTVLHNQLNKMGVPSIHAPMPNSYHSTPNEALLSLKNALFKNNYQYNHELFLNNEVVGGNLSIVYSLLGTNSDVDTDGKVLFLEEIAEYAYNVDRMFFALKKAGKLDKLKGLAIGYFTDIKDDNFGISIKDIILNITKEYNYPVVFDIKAGHEDDNHAIILGKK